MEDFEYVSYEEKRKLKRDEQRAAAGRALFKGIGLAVGGVALSTAAALAGLGGLAISMPIIIGSCLGGPLVAKFFGQKRREKYEDEMHDMISKK